MPRSEATSPVINCSGETAVVLSYWSFSGCESSSWDHMGVEVYNGSSWDEIWANGGSDFQESAWTYYEFNVTPQAAGNANFQVRFYMGTTDGSFAYSGWAVDDLLLSTPADHDLGVKFISPSLVLLGEETLPRIRIENYGANAESSYSVSLVINSTTYDETVNVTDPIAVGTSVVIEMPAWAPSAAGIYLATATVTVTDDAGPGNNMMTSDIEVLSEIIGYAFNAYGGVEDLGPLIVSLSDGDLTSIAENLGNFWAGADFADGDWYTVEYSSNTLLIVNAISGTPTVIDEIIAADITGLAYDITSEVMYTSSTYYNSIESKYESSLYTVDLETAATELVGTSLDDGLIIGIACDAAGNLYAIDIIYDNLLSINKSTGAATVIGSLGIDIGYAQDIAFDRDNDILYGTLYTASGGLYTIDVATGAASLLYDFVSEVTGFARPYSDPSSLTVSFTVTDESSNPLDDANISINGANLTTVGGEASILLENGSYNYIVTLDGYYGDNGTVVVDGANVNEVVTLGIVTGLNELDANVGIYPNPSNGSFIISVDKAYTLEVLSITGEVIYTQELTNTQTNITLDQTAGMYVIHLINNEVSVTSRIIIE